MLFCGAGAAGASLETGVSYVGSQFGFSTSSTLGSLGAQLGDLLIVLNFVGAGTVTMSNGSTFSGSWGNGGTRVLSGTDLSATVSASAPVSLLLYRGATTAVQVVSDIAGAVTNRSVAGYTKNAQHMGNIGLIASTTGSATCSISSPATFATRANSGTSNLADARLFVADRPYPVNPLYVSGTAFIWSCNGASNQLRILELRS